MSERDRADTVAVAGVRAEPALRLEGVCTAYQGREVVHDVSLEVRTGEVVALIGPSGAGKSSLLRTVNLLEPPSSGRVVRHGVEIRSDRRALVAHRRDVGMVFQSFNLFPHLTALQNVELALVRALGVPRGEARERAMRELAHVGLEDHAHARPGRCSGGQQQRIAIARALALGPTLMLFDEPTSALDPELAAEVLATMKKLAAEGMTMLVVTHEMRVAEEVADRIVVMADGRIIEEGPSRELMRAPRTARARRFLSAVRGPQR
jgi:polar amino acid transport system ATP-binding protein